MFCLTKHRVWDKVLLFKAVWMYGLHRHVRLNAAFRSSHTVAMDRAVKQSRLLRMFIRMYAQEMADTEGLYERRIKIWVRN